MALILTDSPADILRFLMIDLGLGVRPSTRSLATPWPIVESLETSAPDDCISLKDTTGTDDGRTMVDGVPHAHFGVQVRIRATDKRTAWTKANSVRTSLATQVRMQSVTVPTSGATYSVAAVTHIGQVIGVGKETPASKRHVFTLNVTVAITQP